MGFSRFHNLLRERIKKVIETKMIAISGGLPPDYAAYRDEVGYIRGLNDALTLCQEIEEDMNK